ncbi:hypothetical protein DFH08DRAFT_818511 [Mycena albidolilacea]|uniref:Uncharacterized protein n=1 Tax=Mycena albidolilacea TaxID=1033008 RepID=A0AAD6ZGS1_9AGAR|nr:hypothetical protein DFH08DRAFT_818511 [Mycena albidolilacea]
MKNTEKLALVRVEAVRERITGLKVSVGMSGSSSKPTKSRTSCGMFAYSGESHSMAEEEDDSETGFSSSNAGELAWGFIDVKDRRGRWDHGEQWCRAELHVMNEAKLGNDLPSADSSVSYRALITVAEGYYVRFSTFCPSKQAPARSRSTEENRVRLSPPADARRKLRLGPGYLIESVSPEIAPFLRIPGTSFTIMSTSELDEKTGSDYGAEVTTGSIRFVGYSVN